MQEVVSIFFYRLVALLFFFDDDDNSAHVAFVDGSTPVCWGGCTKIILVVMPSIVVPVYVVLTDINSAVDST